MKIECVDSRREAVSHAFPTEPLIIEEEAGRRWWLSPPVQSGKKAYRYAALRYTDQDGSHVATEYLEFVSGWHCYVSKENWAAMVYSQCPDGRGTYRRAFNSRPPQALYLRWRRQMIKFLYEGTDELESQLADVDASLEHHRTNQSDRRNQVKAHEERFGRVEHGDMVVVARPLVFNSFADTQAFVMLKAGNGRLIPHIHDENGPRGAGCLYPVHIRRHKKTDFMKVGPAAFEVASNISNHERMRLMALSAEIRARVDAGEEKSMLGWA